MPSPPQRPAVTSTSDIQYLVRTSVGASEYSLSVLSKLFKAFMRYCSNNICPGEQTDKRTDGQLKNRMSVPAVSGGEDKKQNSSKFKDHFHTFAISCWTQLMLFTASGTFLPFGIPLPPALVFCMKLSLVCFMNTLSCPSSVSLVQYTL